jgi:hypothetical protein
MNTPGQNANSVAELVFGLLVFGVRNFFNGTSGTELKGKKLGILAFVNHLTEGPIAEQKEKALADGIKAVMACNDLKVAKTD